MKKQIFAALSMIALFSAGPAFPATSAPGSSEAGRQLVLNSCTPCHAPMGSTQASDAAPPLSSLARDSRADPLSVRAFLMDPHPPAPSIMLSRQQIADVMAYLATLPTD